MSEDNPVLGVGVNNFESRSADFVLQPGRLENTELIVDRPHVAHNVYLQQLAETGVIGLGLLIGFFGAGLLATRSAAQQFRSVGDAPMQGLASAVLVAQIAALSASVFLSNGYDLPLWLLVCTGSDTGVGGGEKRRWPTWASIRTPMVRPNGRQAWTTRFIGRRSSATYWLIRAHWLLCLFIVLAALAGSAASIVTSSQGYVAKGSLLVNPVRDRHHACRPAGDSRLRELSSDR